MTESLIGVENQWVKLASLTRARELKAVALMVAEEEDTSFLVISKAGAVIWILPRTVFDLGVDLCRLL
jgi:hypothetical protein